MELHKENRRRISLSIDAHRDVLDIQYSKGYFTFNGEELLYGILRTALVLALALFWPMVSDSGSLGFSTPR